MRNCCIFTYQAAILGSSLVTGSKFHSPTSGLAAGALAGAEPADALCRHSTAVASSLLAQSVCVLNFRLGQCCHGASPARKQALERAHRALLFCCAFSRARAGIRRTPHGSLGLILVGWLLPFYFGNVITSECGVSCLSCAAGLMTVFFCWLQNSSGFWNNELAHL